MNLVICEDNPFHSQQLLDLLYKWAKTKDIKINYEIFETANKVKEYMLNNRDIDVLFLDVYLEKEEPIGITLANVLRKLDIMTPIILITSDETQAANGYLFDAIGFLSKPIDEYKLALFIEKVLKKQKNNNYIELISGGYKTKINQKDIVYVEKFERKVIFHTHLESLHTDMTLGKVISILDKNEYFKINCSYVVSLSNVKSIKPNRPYSIILLKDDKQIELPVSRSVIKQLMQTYANYMRSELL